MSTITIEGIGTAVWKFELTEEEFKAWEEYEAKRPDLVQSMGYEAILRMFLTNHRCINEQSKPETQKVEKSV